MDKRHVDNRKAIVNHIHAIFKAFLEQDRVALRKLHTDDWVGFLGPSTGIERGLEAYMANAEKSLKSFKGIDYELLDTEIQIHGDIAIVYYIARYDYEDEDGRVHSIPLRSIDIYKRDRGNWNQSGSHITVIPEGGAWGEGSSLNDMK